MVKTILKLLYRSVKFILKNIYSIYKLYPDNYLIKVVLLLILLILQFLVVFLLLYLAHNLILSIINIFTLIYAFYKIFF